MTNNTSTRPIHTFRSGALKATIWCNELQNGKRYHSMSFQRSYQDANGDWRDTTSFGARDLLDLRRLITATEQFIAEQPLD